jgi:L-lysine 2,3-aminomutase
MPVCNQHPILAGINDDPDTLATLYRELSAAGVVPYYMFIVRPTRGNQMFQVPIVRAYEVLGKAKHRLCGLGKRVRLAMSHSTGKIAVLAVDDNFIYVKYHRARDARDEGRLMIFHRDDEALWLEDLTPVELTAGPTTN